MDDHIPPEKVWVIGGSKGIGYAVAERFAGEQATEVFCFSRSGTGPASAVNYKFDLNESGEVLDTQVRDSVDAIGLPGTVIVSAGLGAYFQRWRDARVEEIFRVNLLGTIAVTETLSHLMYHEYHGKIILVGSTASTHGANGLQFYAATKAGLRGYVKSACRHLIRREVALALYEPGWVKTEMIQNMTPEFLEMITKKIPAHRIALPEEIAEDIYLMSRRPIWCLAGSIMEAGGGT